MDKINGILRLYIPPVNPNKKLYNAGSEWQNDIDGLADYYSTYYREYDPVIGRFNGVDPMAAATDFLSVYHYANNSPVNFNDPLGDLTREQFNTIVNSLMGAAHGGHWNAKDGYSYFGNETNAFLAGVDFMDKYNLWGRGGAAANFDQAKSWYYKYGGKDPGIGQLRKPIVAIGKRNKDKITTERIISWGGWGGNEDSEYPGLNRNPFSRNNGRGNDFEFNPFGNFPGWGAGSRLPGRWGGGFHLMQTGPTSPTSPVSTKPPLLKFVGFRDGWIPEFETRLMDGRGAVTPGPFILYPTDGSKMSGYNKHEPGHVLQFWLHGPFYYPLIAFPSTISAGIDNVLDTDYHSKMPWETNADWLWQTYERIFH